MSQLFHVAPGFLVRVGRLWHDDQVLLFVEEDEQAEIFVSNKGEPGCCLGVYSFDELARMGPPIGLRMAQESGDGSPAGVTARVDYQAHAWNAMWNVLAPSARPAYAPAWATAAGDEEDASDQGIEIAEAPQRGVVGDRHRPSARRDAVLAQASKRARQVLGAHA